MKSLSLSPQVQNRDHFVGLLDAIVNEFFGPKLKKIYYATQKNEIFLFKAFLIISEDVRGV